jgi:hypothetical protein
LILIQERKRITSTVLGVMILFNLYSIFNLINTFRRDYNQDLSIFPLGLYIILFLVINSIIIISNVVVTKNLNSFRTNRITEKIQAFFYNFRDRLFMNDKSKDIITSIFYLFCLICGISFIHTLWHELGHAFSMVINGGYFGRVELDFYTYGSTFGAGVSFNLIQNSFMLLSGLLSEVSLGIFLLFFIRYRLKRRSKFNDLIFILVLLIFIVAGLGYFTIPLIFNLLSDSYLLVLTTNIPPLIIFLASFPFFVISLILAFRLLIKFYRTHFKPKRRFFFILFFSCLMYITFFTVFLIIDYYYISLRPLIVIS